MSPIVVVGMRQWVWYISPVIEVLRPIDAIRKRPGMYIGDVTDGSGLHHLIDEAVNNALAEVCGGHCKSILITLNPDCSVTVRDDGRGIPTHTSGHAPIPQVVMTQLHGGRFHGETDVSPKELHGVGIVVVNALSERLELRIWREAAEHYMRFERGRVVVPLRRLGETHRRGTELTFSADPEIFASVQFDTFRIERRLLSLSHLRLGATIALVDRRSASKREITFEI